MNQTPAVTVNVAQIPRIEHDEAMRIAAVENRKFSDLMRALSTEQWSIQTECTRWDVRAMTAHVVGSAASQASPREFIRQKRGGKPICKEFDSPFWWDGMNELQVRERAALTTPTTTAAFSSSEPLAAASSSIPFPSNPQKGAHHDHHTDRRNC